MPQTFTQQVFVDGAVDEAQLRVQGHTTQNQNLQTWENSAGAVLGKVTGDGRLIIGDDTTPDSLVEAHRTDPAATTRPKRGFHSLGKINATLSDLISWAVAELEILGTGGVSGIQAALRSKLTHNNSGTVTAADMRGADIEVINQVGGSANRVSKLTGLQATITNSAAGFVDEAAAVRAVVNNSGSANKVFAFLAEQGVSRLGDTLEIKRPAAVPGNPETDVMRLYPKSDGKLYAKNSGGLEVSLFPTVISLYDQTLGSNGAFDVDLSAIADGVNCTHLELVAMLRSTGTGTSDGVYLLHNNDSGANYRYALLYNNLATPGAVQGSIPIAGYSTASGNPPNYFSALRIFIPFYQAASYRRLSEITNSIAYDLPATSMVRLDNMHFWSGGNPINRIQLRTDNHPTDVFAAGSRLQIIGYKF